MLETSPARLPRRQRLAAALGCLIALSLVAVSGPDDGGVEAAPDPDDSIDLADVPAEGAPAPAVPVEVIPELAAAAEATELRGVEAVEVLETAGLTADVAANVGIEPAELVEELLEDESIFIGATGQVGYVESPPAEAATSELAAPLELGDIAAADPFDLESRPGSAKTIFLDFTGHVTDDGDWTTVTGSTSPIVSAPYDTDGLPESFSPAEQDVIRRVFLHVAEDYAAFDVNVTTAPPSDAGVLRRTSASDPVFGQRVVVTPSNFMGGQVLGIALIGSFDLDRDSPAFVFSDRLGDDAIAAKTIAEAVSHEVGHTVGLFHDGTTNSEYYFGSGSWAPIMGNSIRPLLTQWSRGEYPNANNQEDDVAEIAACLGVRPDDWPDGGTDGPGVVGDVTVSGVIGAFGDIDSIPVEMGAGTLEIRFRPVGPSPNLHAEIRLAEDDGRVVWTRRSSTPAGEVWVATSGMPAGRYAVEVWPAGYSVAPTVFTSYGSMGHYEIEIVAPPPVGPGVDDVSAVSRAVRVSVPPDC